MSRKRVYKANSDYIEDCTYMVVVEMLERLPQLKLRIRKYLEAFPS